MSRISHTIGFFVGMAPLFAAGFLAGGAATGIFVTIGSWIGPVGRVLAEPTVAAVAEGLEIIIGLIGGATAAFALGPSSPASTDSKAH
ncbi:MAG TPA: hypothetical protein VII56_15970 [Rhizomicrobium sp.]